MIDPTANWLYDIPGNMFVPLVGYDVNSSQIEPAGADSWTISDDGLTYTFHIREQWTWSDGTPVTADVYVVSSVQEEVGVRGIPTAAHVIAPDVAIAIDGSLPSDTPYARDEQRQCILGEGTGIYLMDNRTIGNPELVRGLITTCESRNIAYQRNLGRNRCFRNTASWSGGMGNYYWCTHTLHALERSTLSFK